MVTIKDVAKLANVSLGTTSRALQGIGYVSEEAKNKVLAAAKELGYVVNYGAKFLKNNASNKTVGIIISASRNDYFYHIISSLQEVFRNHNIGLTVAFSSNNQEDELRQFKYMIGNRVSSILFVPATDQNEEVLELAKKNNISVIQLFVKVYKNFDAVVNDDEYGCYLATNHLINSGCKKIALLDVDYKNFKSGNVEPNRSNGLVDACKDQNIEYKIIKHNPDKIEQSVYEQIEEFNPDGIIAGTGTTGLKILEYLKMSSRSIKLVTFDENEWFQYLGVTTVRQNIKKLSDVIYQLITKDNNDSNENPLFEKIPGQLIIRKQ